MGKQKFVLSFYTTNEAMSAEFICKSNGIDGKLIPVPRHMSAGCGMAWMTDLEFKDRLIDLINDEDIEWEDSAVIEI
ncbi:MULTISPECIES: DUF3343 domain-containing protein [Peptostreptococcus]|uniref:Putative Se/S carrier protein-like domain-containing protein n=1 Tax=Peptostreptococcus anaerobius TaxID=1261 RepID=A0A135YVX0_9FIRM|nr:MULTISPECIES: DUF3343 domain-containing protein [Peptostreptococcus]KXI13554.1 hypothetical protein HMPREF3195_00635 [Peptostreptococcus anaerobius]MDU1598602.1 DUF3343 domain-containing protein [Peptostreptococcus anaerobius]MDU1682311.1 DUF3343 domain-containing protein [Peptostreptococcus anaerobius]MDU3422710.1 DUF3343 domain-containing protein [Peptostreptococcus anaerobius]MDU3429594.1 DUF3343 domain-containing protein [Peptostreptococcus sp.]